MVCSLLIEDKQHHAQILIAFDEQFNQLKLISTYFGGHGVSTQPITQS
jgi:hypothetical protein